MIKGKKTFRVVSSGRDEYPGNGLYIADIPTHFFEARMASRMDALEEDDEVEITISVLSRRIIQRKRP